MISTLRGRLRSKTPTEIVLEANGVGYGISIPLSTFEQLGNPDSETLLYTHLHVREDILQLFGFATEVEREAFRMLISVTGIGPRMAQGILSGISVRDLRDHLSRGNPAALTNVPGIGKKLAERLVLELRDKAARLQAGPQGTAAEGDARERARAEALLALTSLGYSRPAADKALHSALSVIDGPELTVEQLIKASLKIMTR
jgi:holliday junction DNA helicase RuvA